MRLFELSNKKLYIICFIPRSGSNYLCSILEKHGLGSPTEYYYPYELKDRYQYWKLRLPKYFNRFCETNHLEFFKSVLNISPGICGIKTSWDSLKILHQECDELLKQIEIKYLYMTRDDKIRQAISWAISLTTDIWSSDDKQVKTDIKYSRELIDKCLGYIKTQESLFAEYLQNKRFIEIKYEQLNNLDINNISEFIDEKIIYKPPKVLDNYEKLNNDLHIEWYNKYAST